VRRLVVSRPFKGVMISVQKVAQTRSIIVRGIPAGVNKDFILLYFEKHAGVDVTGISPLDDHFVITFADFEGDCHVFLIAKI